MKMHQMFFIHTTLEVFRNATITGHKLNLCLRQTRPGNSRDYSDVIVFSKALFSKSFLFARKRKTSVFKFLRYEERFRQVPFSYRINVDGRPNRGKEAVLFNSSGIVSTLHIGYREN